MNAIDIVIIIPLLWGFWRGFMKGMIMEAATLAAFFFGVWGGMHLSESLAKLIRHWFDSTSAYIPLIAFAFVFVLILMAVFAVGKMAEKFAEGVALGFVNKFAGGAFGMLKYLFLFSVLFFVLDEVEEKVKIVPDKMKAGSLLYEPVSAFAPAVIPGLREIDLGGFAADTIEVNTYLMLKDSIE